MVNYDGNGQTRGIMMGWRCFCKPLCAVVFRNRFPNICLPPPFTKCLLIRELFVCVRERNEKHNGVDNKWPAMGLMCLTTWGSAEEEIVQCCSFQRGRRRCGGGRRAGVIEQYVCLRECADTFESLCILNNEGLSLF